MAFDFDYSSAAVEQLCETAKNAVACNTIDTMCFSRRVSFSVRQQN